MIFESLRDTATLQGKISILRQNHIDGLNLQFPGNLAYLSKYVFRRLRGKPSFKDDAVGMTPDRSVSEVLLTGLYAMQHPFCYIIDAYPQQTSIYIGTKTGSSSDDSSACQTILEGYWGAGFIIQDTRINQRINELAQVERCGAITGIPVVESPSRTHSKRQYLSDFWLRSLQGERWTYLVAGIPIPGTVLTQYESQIIDEIALLRIRMIRDDILYEERRSAEYYQKLLETVLQRLERGRLSGTWQTGVYFFADNEALTRRGLAILSAHLGGRKSFIQPVRAHLCAKDASLPASFSNLLVTAEAAPLIDTPSEEMPGYTVRREAKFNTDVFGMTISNPIGLGSVVRNSRITGMQFSVNAADLTKHVLLAGVTGSGKTTTCFHILRQLVRQKIPFLVIESAKSEYRQLLRDPYFKDMLIFTLGDETPGSAAPFRINPFEVPEGILVQTHLDYLKSLFRASFVLYAPMPYVLEEALHEVYRDKGWNLSANLNVRGSGPGAFPTLTDLYEKIGEVVERLGYSEDISRDVLAGLRTRINNLRLGGKGLMLDTHWSVPIEEIMEKPVLLELKRLGNDDEKSFLIGLFLTRVYEYYEGRSQGRTTTGDLVHVTLIEEAHRLLKHVPEESGTDGNVRSKAVETFCNMLSEIRSYGESIIVSEQIPDKLARDVIKNSSLKIMHRLAARDDRDIMGDTMNLSEDQKAYAATLPPGRTIVFSEGMDSPFLVNVPFPMDSRGTAGTPVTSRLLSEHMKKKFYGVYERLLLKYPECGTCSLGGNHCELVRESVKNLVSHPRQKEQFNKLFIAAAVGSLDKKMIADIDRSILENITGMRNVDVRSMRFCYVIHSTYLGIGLQAGLYGYPYADMEKLIVAFADLMRSYLWGDGTNEATLNTFRTLFAKLREIGEPPFAGCFVCNNRCHYRYEASLFLRDRDINADFDYLTTKIRDDNEMWLALADLCESTGRRIIPEDRKDRIRGIALCYLSQKTAQAHYAPRVQEKTLRNVYAVFEGRK